MSNLSKEDYEFIRKAGKISRECLDMLAREIKEGTSTKLLDKKAEAFIISRKATPAFRGYKGFPASICTSINEVVVHGIPKDSEILKAGDIISIDVGVEYSGLYADTARTFLVGDVGQKAAKLVSVTEEALYKGIEMAKAGNAMQDISWAIQSHVEEAGFNVVRAFVGHGIGRKIHEDPEIPNYGRPHEGRIIQDGMVLAIEPMANEGTADVRILDDGWTAVTKDKGLSAHFEHTVIIRGDKAEIVT